MPRILLNLKENAGHLPKLSLNLEGYRVETWFALVQDRDGASMEGSSDEFDSRGFSSRESALKATENLSEFQGGWGRRGKPYPVLVLTKDGKTGYLISEKLAFLNDEELDRKIKTKARNNDS